jgi:FlaA1/EpsC-like NDP-sugar epimerase
MERFLAEQYLTVLQFLPESFAARPLRRAVLGGLYVTALSLSLWLGFCLRFDFAIQPEDYGRLITSLLWIIPLKLFLLYYFGQFKGLLGYFSIPDLHRLFGALGTAAVIEVFVWLLLHGQNMPPRGVILADFVLSFCGLGSMRLGFRVFKERINGPRSGSEVRVRRVGIIGAGHVGASLGHELKARRGLGLDPVAFFDDDPAKWDSQVHGIPVLGALEAMTNIRERLDLVVIAMPSAPAKRLQDMVQLLHKEKVAFQTVPSVDQLATGKVRVSQLRPVEIQDLLGREAVALEVENIRRIIERRVVMVTGAGGSIGSELCRQIATFQPSNLLLVDQSEVQLFQIEQELIGLGHEKLVVPLIADIYDEQRMRAIFEGFHPAVIFHAGAHKHVPMMESQPGEAIKNNTLATAQLAELAAEHRVERFVMISTDKAINPTNVMGATKRMAEMFVQSLNAEQKGLTKFMAVRFGNVLGSSGSVIPTFNKQIAAGGPVRVTHPEITRYFMTIPEAAGLVLQSGAQGSGGEIFVLDMGRPVKILDLATQLIELHGLRPGEDIQIEFAGLRPGEKLFEELCYEGENIAPTHHPKIMRLITTPGPLQQVRQHLERMAHHVNGTDAPQLKMLLHDAVPEYRPYLPRLAGKEDQISLVG